MLTNDNAVEFKMHEFLHTFSILLMRLTWAAVAQTVWRLTTGQTVRGYYGLDGTGIESRYGPRFPHPSRTTVLPTQPPVTRVPSSFLGVEAAEAWYWSSTLSNNDVKKKYNYTCIFSLGLHNFSQCEIYSSYSLTLTRTVQQIEPNLHSNICLCCVQNRYYLPPVAYRENGLGFKSPLKIRYAFQNRAKIKPIVKTVKNCRIQDAETTRCSEKKGSKALKLPGSQLLYISNAK